MREFKSRADVYRELRKVTIELRSATGFRKRDMRKYRKRLETLYSQFRKREAEKGAKAN